MPDSVCISRSRSAEEQFAQDDRAGGLFSCEDTGQFLVAPTGEAYNGNLARMHRSDREQDGTHEELRERGQGFRQAFGDLLRRFGCL